MIVENSFIETNQEYKTGIAIDEYNGAYALVAAQAGKDGKIYTRWGYPEKNKQPMGKSIPWKITIGDGEQAVAALTALRNVLLGGEPETDPESEIPF